MIRVFAVSVVLSPERAISKQNVKRMHFNGWGDDSVTEQLAVEV